MNNDKVYQTYLERIDEFSNINMTYEVNNCRCESRGDINHLYNVNCQKCVFYEHAKDSCNCYLNKQTEGFSQFLEKYYPERFL